MISLPWALAVVWAAGGFDAKVVGITDGDTLTVMHVGRAEAIRLYGIDAPERRQAWAARAKQLLGALTFGQTVHVSVRGRDRYGRTLADVTLRDGRHVNHELVRAGVAWWYRKYAPRDRRLEALEQEAREAQRGLWQDADPQPPWEHRKRPARPAGVEP
jgi:endonuclease YncB( thermonuclease family)